MLDGEHHKIWVEGRWRTPAAVVRRDDARDAVVAPRPFCRVVARRPGR